MKGHLHFCVKFLFIEQVFNTHVIASLRQQAWQSPTCKGISYFLSGEKVCKEPPRTSRMVLGLSRRLKGKADRVILKQHFFRFPLRNPLARLCKKVFKLLVKQEIDSLGNEGAVSK